MDDLLSEFLTETSESLDVVDCELVKFEQDPNNAEILDNIFRLVHTIKGTCGFLGLPRLESLAHAAETLMGKFRDGAQVTNIAVTIILESLDRIKEILAELEQNAAEPEGDDDDLISRLDELSANNGVPAGEASESAAEEPEIEEPFQIVERELKPGEVSLEELERAFQEAPGPEADEAEEAPAPAEAKAAEAPCAPAPEEKAAAPAAKEAKPAGDGKTADKKEAVVKTQSIRVNVDTLEHLMTTVSELVLTRNQLLEMVRRLQDSEFKVPLQRLSNVTAELQEGVMKTRMQPIGNAWQKLPRIVRDLAQDLDKKIELQMTGADTELDRQVLELIKDPLTHMVRNSADHGLETPEERRAAGKSEKGHIDLSAYHEGGHIIIEIADDGNGLNAERIKQKALENGITTQAELEKMTEAQIHKFIFKAGFSTAKEVTSVSGRGVGMDVVRTNIELIGGSVDVKSEQGKGSTFYIKIPLTLAIISALIVEANGHRFAVPQLAVVELVRAQADSDHRIEVINDTPVLRLREKLLPLIHLGKLLGIESANGNVQHSDAEPAVGEAEAHDGADGGDAPDDGLGESSFIIVTQVGPQSYGIVVDGVFDTEEIVVKPMSTMLRDISMFSGNTILGDGSVIMIVDPNGIAQMISGSAAAEHLEEYNEDSASVDTSDAVISMLVFRAGSEEPKAVPLSLVTRLEEIKIEEIEYSNGRHVVQYRGKLMPLVYVNEEAKHRDAGMQPILVFTDDDHVMGLVVDEIVDIVEERLNVEVQSTGPGVIGSAVIQGRATEIIDIGYFLPQAFADWFRNKETGFEVATRRVLLVDDSSFFRNMLCPVLSSGGFAVTAVESAEDALKLCENGEMFDVIVTDIEMPQMDGFAFANAVSGNSRWNNTPLVALSSHTSQAIIERAREASFIDYVGKFDREGLMDSLKSAIESLGEAA